VPDLIFTSGGTEPVNAVQRQTQTIPIVFGGVGAAGESGYRTPLENIARPEGNATGFPDTFCSLGGRWLQLLKDAAPRLARVAVIFNPDLNRRIQGGGCYAAPINAGAPVLAIQVAWMPYRTAAELDRAIDAFAAEPNGGLLLLPPNGHFGAVRETIYRLATEHRLPTIYSQSDFVKDGGLMSYGANYADLIRQSASYVDRILRGTKPGDLPVQLPTKFEFVINLKTAKTLGLTIPETLLATADEVIQ
jgi:putative tryptophan/tyrosine transport system substrate-binding protein